MIRYDDGLELT